MEHKAATGTEEPLNTNTGSPFKVNSKRFSNVLFSEEFKVELASRTANALTLVKYAPVVELDSTEAASGAAEC